VARALLERLAGEALGCDPARVRLAHDPAGRPVVAEPSGAATLACSISHAGAVAAAAVAIGCRAGVDVEPVDPRRADLPTVSRYLDAPEAARLAGLGPDERPAALALAWTRLEAEAKGRGVALDRLRGRAATGTSLALDVAPGHVGTLWTDRAATVRQVTDRAATVRHVRVTPQPRSGSPAPADPHPGTRPSTGRSRSSTAR
jgi:4'-phosphopantetheinyl transferase